MKQTLTGLLVILPLLLAAQDQPGNRLPGAFKRLDKNDDGKLTAVEAPDRAEMIRAADADESGDVTLEEVRAFLLKNRSPQPDPNAKPLFINSEEIPPGAPVTESSCQAASDYSARHNGYSMLVMHEGTILFERYDQGWNPEKPHRLASGTKSFSGAMLAAAVKDKLLTIDEPVSKTITEWKDDSRLSKITIRQLLSLTSGIDPGGIGNVPAYADSFQTETRNEPGTKFAYGPRPFQIFGELMTRKLAASEELDFADPLAYLEERIFKPIGMEVAGWRRDSNGKPHLPSGAQMTAREWAKFGQFLLQKGKWKGQQLVDAETLAECFNGSKANPGYGLTFWRLDSAKNSPKALEGAYSASGAGKQRLFVIPKKNLVVIRQGESKVFDNLEFLKLLLTPSPESGPAR